MQKLFIIYMVLSIITGLIVFFTYYLYSRKLYEDKFTLYAGDVFIMLFCLPVTIPILVVTGLIYVYLPFHNSVAKFMSKPLILSSQEKIKRRQAYASREDQLKSCVKVLKKLERAIETEMVDGEVKKMLDDVRQGTIS